MLATSDALSRAEAGSEAELVRSAMDLGAARCGGPPSGLEEELLTRAAELEQTPGTRLEQLRHAIREGSDPLGEIFCQIRPPGSRRGQGIFYTPQPIVRSMVGWVLSKRPSRAVDAGCGSGRFTVEMVRRHRDLAVIANDQDPVQTLLTRAALAVVGATNARVIQGDYTQLVLPRHSGTTAFISNPPYVRHHDLTPEAKSWAAAAARRLGHTCSGLAGLHAHFFLATALLGSPGDVGCFVTSAEWLDVGYGATIRALLLNGLGGESLHLVESSAAPFEDAQSTAIISCFQLGKTPDEMRLKLVSSIDQFGDLRGGTAVPRSELQGSARWSSFAREQAGQREDNGPRIGDFLEVHRGLVTGANDYFILNRDRAATFGLASWCVPAITDGKEILESGGVLRDTPERKVLLRVPKDMDRRQCPAVDAYLRIGETPAGDPRAVANRYISAHRRPWWYLGAQQPPPIVASYMARQAPVFALNPDGLALINIGHGLYPKKAMTWTELERLVAQLNSIRQEFRGRGRTYQGGLEKFEPREMEALPLSSATPGAANG